MNYAKSIAVLTSLALVTGCGLVSRVTGRTTYTVPGVAMEPTIASGQSVTGRLTAGEYVPHRGDIVAFRAPDSWAQGDTLLYRVIAIGGDKISCCDPQHRWVLNGKALDEPYLSKTEPDTIAQPSATIPDGHVWVMGDNRNQALDSRMHRGADGGGAVPVANVVAVIEP